jgi:hypothetical protein
VRARVGTPRKKVRSNSLIVRVRIFDSAPEISIDAGKRGQETAVMFQ